jgi:hypothetical protein
MIDTSLLVDMAVRGAEGHAGTYHTVTNQLCVLGTDLTFALVQKLGDISPVPGSF